MLKFDHKTLNHRQKAVLNYVLKYGKSHVGDLAKSFEVSEQTIRNDLDKLYELKLLQRVHGGAMVNKSHTGNKEYLNEGIRNIGYLSRTQMYTEEKDRIGDKTAELIPSNSSLFINIGTTTESVAKAIQSKVGLMVVTNNLNIANTLRYSKDNEVMIASGIVRPEDGGIVGAAAIDFIEQFRMDFAVVGISGIDEDGKLLDFDFREVQVTKTIMKNARSVILVADHSKFERKAPVILSGLSEINYLVTDKIPKDSIYQICEENKVQLLVTDTAENLSREKEIRSVVEE